MLKPDEFLAEIFADAVAGIAGARPDASQVAEFLASVIPSQPVAPTQVVPARSRPPQPVETLNAGSPGVKGYTGTTPAAFFLDGTRHEVATWRELLLAVANLLLREDQSTFSETLPEIRGNKRQYFSTDPDSLFAPLPLDGDLYYAEGNLNSNDIVRISRWLLKAIRGTDQSFEVQLKA